MKNLPLSAVLLKAMDNAHEGITISDMSLPDNPLIYVNKGFFNMTGYTAEECLGRNCRYLQGPQTDPQTVERIRHAISHQQAIQVELLNYHKNGTPFWNYFSLTPIFNETGQLTHYIGIQEDVTAKKILQQKEALLEQKRSIAEAVLEAQDAERQEIGQELHDHVNQLIATIRLYLNLAKEKPANQADLIAFAIELTDKLVQEVRQVSHRLVGPAFARQTLLQALEQLADSLQPAVPFTIRLLQKSIVEEKISTRQKQTLYRIVQEQLNNILKHASASEVSIELLEKDNSLHLSIYDNGVGFDPHRQSGGIGFRNMHNRVELENGSLQIESVPGEGCRLTVRLPLPAAR